MKIGDIIIIEVILLCGWDINGNISLMFVGVCGRSKVVDYVLYNRLEIFKRGWLGRNLLYVVL